MDKFLGFRSLQAAREYRHEQGTGGWIFVSDATGYATIFPPEFPPAAIFNHPMTRGQSGQLIGNA